MRASKKKRILRATGVTILLIIAVTIAVKISLFINEVFPLFWGGFALFVIIFLVFAALVSIVYRQMYY